LPVAVLREWRSPGEAGIWGVFIGTKRSHVFQPVSRRHTFKAAQEAREAADTEVGHWVKSDEW
jgi:hypothetical protein